MTTRIPLGNVTVNIKPSSREILLIILTKPTPLRQKTVLIAKRAGSHCTVEVCNLFSKRAEFTVVRESAVQSKVFKMNIGERSF